jgi:alpha-amylase/alpha-mannosidase (GH57 family)
VERYICIHGHFYQPPRENAWLEAVEVQDSAYPYHDWNERITVEAYAPNATSRILDGEGWITRIVNNYVRISFNVGPTLLEWIQVHSPDLYNGLLAADRESQRTFGGHGSAIAQAYNHMIMPLANRRDKITQVVWGMRDFEYRFGRKPEGMWLPETAVDLETLDVLAEHGIRFTILTPYQARRSREIGGSAWQDVGPSGIDPTMAYRTRRLPSGKTVDLFFYDGPISRAVAFERLLSSGETFAHRLVSGFNDRRSWPQLMHIATDGETYGHHHRHGDMALAYALHYIESNKLARITNYGEYLEKCPPTHEVEIVENTSWSCAHGLERWRSNCGCNSGGGAGWTQQWRAPLREALDWLRDTLAPQYEALASQFLKDPWAARDDYIVVILDRSPESVERFLRQHAARDLNAAEQVVTLKLLELQRHTMLMFTSCGWFFDEISGIEPVQVLQYAGRAVQLAQELFSNSLESRFGELLDPSFLRAAKRATNQGLEERFLELLERAPSNLPEHRNGRDVYEKYVKPAMVDLTKLGAHYAVASLFESFPEQAEIYCYTADRHDYHRFEAGRAQLAVGQAQFTSRITRESAPLSFAVLHFGDHNLNAGVREFKSEAAYRRMVEETTRVFERADFAEVIRTMDRHYGTVSYSLRSLFRDEQRRILGAIADGTLAEVEGVYRQLYEHHAPLMRFLADLSAPLPAALQAAASFILNIDLRRAFADDAADLDHVQALLDEVKTWRVDLDTNGLAYTLRHTVDRLALGFQARPAELRLLERFEQLVTLARGLPFEVELWRPQNV